MSKRTPVTKPSAEHGQGEADGERQVGHHAAEQQRQPVDRAEQQPVEVPALDVGTRVVAREMPVTPKMMATGSWKAR